MKVIKIVAKNLHIAISGLSVLVQVSLLLTYRVLVRLKRSHN